MSDEMRDRIAEIIKRTCGVVFSSGAHEDFIASRCSLATTAILALIEGAQGKDGGEPPMTIAMRQAGGAYICKVAGLEHDCGAGFHTAEKVFRAMYAQMQAERTQGKGDGDEDTRPPAQFVQEFEKYPALARDVEYLANKMHGISITTWSEFLATLNQTLIAVRSVVPPQVVPQAGGERTEQEREYLLAQIDDISSNERLSQLERCNQIFDLFCPISAGKATS